MEPLGRVTSHRNKMLNFPIPTKLQEPKKLKGWVLGI